jgi:hypothetical protein
MLFKVSKPSTLRFALKDSYKTSITAKGTSVEPAKQGENDF